MEQTINSKSRGGRREGSGRKAVDASCKKVSVTFSLSPEQKARIQAAARKEGVSSSVFLGRIIDRL